MSMKLPPAFEGLLPGANAAAQSSAALPGAFAALLPQQIQQIAAANPANGSLPFQVGPWNTGVQMPQWLSRGLAGTGQGMTQIARDVGNMAGGIFGTGNAALKRDAKLDAPLLRTPAGRVGNFLGETAALAPLGGGVDVALDKAGILGGSGLMSALGRGAIQGGVQGVASAAPGRRLSGALLGGVAGTAMPLLGGIGGKIVNGITRTDAAQKLLDEGISLTPGQMNPRGVLNRMEQATEALPVVGDMAQNARENAMQQYTRAMVNRSMAPGTTLPEGPMDFNAMIEHAAKSFEGAYEPAKGIPVGPKIMNEGADEPLDAALKRIANKPRIGLTAADRASWGNQFQDQLKEVVAQAKRAGGMTSDHLLAFRSSLRDALRAENGDTASSRAVRSMLQDAEHKVTESLESQITPEAAQALRDADSQYAKFSVVRDAAKAVKDAPNGPTPFQLSNAIAQHETPNAYARGAGLNRDLSKAAREVFQSNVPRTGFTGVGRVLPLLGAGGLGGFAAADPEAAKKAGLWGALPLLALGGAAYSPMGREAFAGNTGIQQALRGGIDRITGALSPELLNILSQYAKSALIAGAAPQVQGPVGR